MVPRDHFNRMATLALVAIILLLTFSCRAYAAEVSYIDSGPVPEEGGGGTLADDIFAIRQMMETVLYFVIPFVGAVWLVYKFCMWFYYTFIRTVL